MLIHSQETAAEIRPSPLPSRGDWQGKQRQPTPRTESTSTQYGGALSGLSTHEQVASKRKRCAREWQKKIVREAWDEYQQTVQPRVLRQLDCVQARSWQLTEGKTIGAKNSSDVVNMRNEIVTALIEACAELLVPACTIADASGQTDYIGTWMQLWSDIIDRDEMVLPKQILPLIPPLCSPWPNDSILKRAYVKATSNSWGRCMHGDSAQ